MSPSHPEIPPGTQTVPFAFESTSAAPGPDWERRGNGNACFRITPAGLRVEEAGEWREAGGASTARHAFRKTFHLEKRSERELAVHKHVPDGETLELLTLVLADGVWTSPEPHLCLEDEYRCELRLDDSDTLHITWWSRGPAKNYALHTRYGPTPLTRIWLDS
jgi:hypothetical protein